MDWGQRVSEKKFSKGTNTLGFLRMNLAFALSLKDIYFCLIEFIKVLDDNGQFHYLTNLKGP